MSRSRRTTPTKSLAKYKRRMWGKPMVITDAQAHTMGKDLLAYLKIKIHHLVEEGWYKDILVVGEYDRSCTIGKCEKSGKMANWQRPTADIIDETLVIKCFPGRDYVRHYASLIATYLALCKKDPHIVSYVLPDDSEAWQAVKSLDMEVLPASDVVIFGHGLFEVADDDAIWQANQEMVWTQQQIGKTQVTFVIFQFSFWGDIIGRITAELAQIGYKTIVFVGKVGGIAPDLTPNKSIITGSRSYVEGEIVDWENIFAKAKHPDLTSRVHIHSPSVLFEDKRWVKMLNHFDVVDPETGHFARAALRSGARFGYLHFTSNSLTRRLKENLSNERLESVLLKRAKVISNIRDILIQTILGLDK